MDDIFLDIGRFIVKKQKAAGIRDPNSAAQLRFSRGFSVAPAITARSKSLTRTHLKTNFIISSTNIKKAENQFNPFVGPAGFFARGLIKRRKVPWLINLCSEKV